MIVPVWGLHRDENYFNEPDEFWPERFSRENLEPFVDMPYLGFGSGPRGCIGIRVGRIQVKLALILLLRKFRFELDDKHSEQKIEISAKALFTAPANGINLKVKNRL